MRYSVSQAARLAGVSVRTLRWYDQIGLLKPTEVTPAGYRLYDGEAMAVLQQILFYRELDMPLEQIGRILSAPGPRPGRGIAKAPDAAADEAAAAGRYAPAGRRDDWREYHV